MDLLQNSSSLPHRLPTVSAAEALLGGKTQQSRFIPTRLRHLDSLLQSDGAEDLGGIERGQLTEIYGPPGVGKTALATHLAAVALQQDARVAWIDAAYSLPGKRLSAMIETSIERLDHFFVPSLAHLISLICHPAPGFPASGTSLVIIDSLSTLFSNAYPRNADAGLTTPKSESRQWATVRKYAVLQTLITGLLRFSAIHNIAVVILNETFTKMRENSKAVLVPGIRSTAWESAVATRLALYRDWANEYGKVGARFIMVQKLAGSPVQETTRVAEFRIKKNKVYTAAQRCPSQQLPSSMKRKFDDVQEGDLEPAEDEDYGWDEEDEDSLPSMPPQWQGSEDLLIRHEAQEDETDDNSSGSQASSHHTVDVGL